MKKDRIPLRILLFSVVLFSGFSGRTQRDTVAEVTIYNQIRSMQFGADLFFQEGMPIQEEIPLVSEKDTEYYSYYRQKYLVYDPVKDPRRLVYNTGLFAGAALMSFGVLWVLPESVSNWDKQEMLEYGMLNRWKDNVRAGPTWDEDAFFLNWILHPWAGGVYHMTARGSGYNKWESFAYTTFMSTFLWEYGIEAFAEIPSWQDLFITPIAGSILGEFFFKWKVNIIKNERKVFNSRFVGGTALFLMDPFNVVLDGLNYKTKNKVQSYSAFIPIDYDFSSKKSIWGIRVVMLF